MYRTVDGAQKEIRIAILQPGSADDTLRCTLQHISLSDAANVTPYETISYAWGDNTIRETILIDGAEADVTVNSAAALRRMRLRDKRRTLWIDAICINQADEHERSSQVALMAEVYSLSIGNLVWLGPATESTKQALHAIQVVLDNLNHKTDGFRSMRDTLYGSGGDANWEISRISDPFDEASVREFFSAPWFTRRWVVQEVALPKSSICYRGEFEVPLVDLLRVAAWINFHYLTFARMQWSRGVQAAATMHSFADRTYGWCCTRDSPKPHMSLDWTLTVLSDFDNSDPRDSIYGVLGLYRMINEGIEGESIPITPDYSLSHGAILTMVAVRCFREEIRLRLLNSVQHLSCNYQQHKAATWAPRYDRLDRPPFLPHYRAAQGGPLLLPFFTITSDHKLLTRGYSLGTINRRSADMTDIWEDPRQSANLLRDMIDLTRQAATQSSLEDVLGITLCGGRSYDATAADQSVAAMTYASFQERLLQYQELPPWPYEIDLDPATLEGKQSQYRHETMHVCIGRRLFSTDAAHVGVASEILQVGDKLALLAGCDWPVVVRSTGKGHEHEFVGTAYVHGIMFGQAMKKCMDENRPLEAFDLV